MGGKNGFWGLLLSDDGEGSVELTEDEPLERAAGGTAASGARGRGPAPATGGGGGEPARCEVLFWLGANPRDMTVGGKEWNRRTAAATV